MELLFYHLERAPLERVLPDLLSRSLSKGWRAIVEASPFERVEAIDAMLWTYQDDSFLPHGTVKDEDASLQPIVLTDSLENSNNADIRFFIDTGDVAAHLGYKRLVYIFNGNDEAAVSRARLQWKAAKAADIEATYWQQTEAGRWEKKA